MPLAKGWVVANINVGILYLFAVSSLGVYGMIMGGWASNSKYPFLAALRSAAQMVSYEVSIGFVIITVLLFAGSLNLSAIVHAAGSIGVLGSALERLHHPVPDVGDLLRLVAGRNQPPAVRPAGSGIRTGGRLHGGIFLDAVPAVLPRRVREHHPALRPDERSCSSAAGCRRSTSGR